MAGGGAWGGGSDTGQNALETKERGDGGEEGAGQRGGSALPANASRPSYSRQMGGWPPVDVQPKPEGAAAWWREGVRALAINEPRQPSGCLRRAVKEGCLDGHDKKSGKMTSKQMEDVVKEENRVHNAPPPPPPPPRSQLFASRR